MKTLELEAVLQSAFGGFSIDTEMALWLMENRQWIITLDYDWTKKKFYPINSIFEQKVGNQYYYYSPHDKDIEFRSHKDLIDCVRALKEKHKDDPYPDSWYGHIQGLKIVKVSIELGVENYHDGKEKINFSVRNADNED